MGRYRDGDEQSMILVALSGEKIRVLHSGDSAVSGIICNAGKI